MPNVGPQELLIALVIAVLILGPRRVPETGRAIGRSLHEFKGGLSGPEERPAVED